MKQERERNNAPELWLLFKAFHTSGQHWNNNLDMPSTKRFPIVQALSFVHPRPWFSRNAINSLYISWFVYIHRSCPGNGGKKTYFVRAIIIGLNGFTCDLEETACSTVGCDKTLKWKECVQNDSITNIALQSMQAMSLAISFLLADPVCTKSCWLTQDILTYWAEERSSGSSRCELKTNCNNSRHVFVANQTSSNGMSKVFSPSLRLSGSTNTVSMRTPSILKQARLSRADVAIFHKKRFKT